MPFSLLGCLIRSALLRLSDSSRPSRSTPSTMRIQKLRIENFKGIRAREFSFESQFSVLIGENATGKTTVLDALAVALGSFLLGIEGAAGRGIRPDEIRVVDVHGQPRPQKPVLIEATGELDGRPVGPWRRELTSRNTTSAGAKPISSLAQAKLRASRQPPEEQGARPSFRSSSTTAPAASGPSTKRSPTSSSLKAWSVDTRMR